MNPNNSRNRGTSMNRHQRCALKSNGTSFPRNVHGRKNVCAGSVNSASAASSFGNGQIPVNCAVATSKRATPCGTYWPVESVSYTHLRAHETPEHLVCRLLLEKK